MSRPSQLIVPRLGVIQRHSSLASVVLPAPFSPTTATVSPSEICIDTPSSTGSGRLG